MGLYNNACKSLLTPNSNYQLNEEDEIWFIIHTDKWGKEVENLRASTANHKNWFVAQSNPCFEVWLYYHFEKEKPKKTVANWKEFLNDVVKGGFNTTKHPIFIQTAIVNSEANFSCSNNQPDPVSTELFILSKKILPLIKSDIDELLSIESIN